MKKFLAVMGLALFTAGAAPVHGGAKFAVIMPEQVERDWYWIHYSEVSQHIVQTMVERSLIRAGMTVIDISAAEMPAFGGQWQSLSQSDFAVRIGRELGVDYVVAGFATAVKASESDSYGVRTVRSQADITARVISVSDGRVVEAFDANRLSGGQSVGAAAKRALREAGGIIGGKIGRWSMSLNEHQH